MPEPVIISPGILDGPPQFLKNDGAGNHIVQEGPVVTDDQQGARERLLKGTEPEGEVGGLEGLVKPTYRSGYVLDA